MTFDELYAIAAKRKGEAAQEALNLWAKQGGRSLAQVSIVAACSIDAPR